MIFNHFQLSRFSISILIIELWSIKRCSKLRILSKIVHIQNGFPLIITQLSSFVTSLYTHMHAHTNTHTHKHRHTHTLTHGNAAPALPSPWFKSQRWTLYCKPSVELTSSKRLKALSSSFTKPLRPSKLLLQKNIQAKSFNRKSCKTWTNITMKKYWYTIFQ